MRMSNMLKLVTSSSQPIIVLKKVDSLPSLQGFLEGVVVPSFLQGFFAECLMTLKSLVIRVRKLSESVPLFL